MNSEIKPKRQRKPITDPERLQRRRQALSVRTVQRWGWKAMLRKVLEDREAHAGQPGLFWSDRQMLLALVAAFRHDGAWPTTASWEQATDEHPSGPDLRAEIRNVVAATKPIVANPIKGGYTS